MNLSANFTLAEFERVSRAPLTSQQIEHARWHALELQRLRDTLNATYTPPDAGGEWRIRLTSFIRDSGGGDHATGAGLDWQVVDKNGAFHADLTKWGRDWFAINRPQSFAELLWEHDHVHQARRGYSRDASANQTPQILDEIAPDSGRFEIAVIKAIPQPVRPIIYAAGAFAAAYLFAGKAR